MSPQPNSLFPEIEPYQFGFLPASGIHQIYYEQCGNPNGYPVIFLHGGPGSGCNSGQRRFFDPEFYRIVLFDQRGCGRSMPLGSIHENTTNHLLDDIELLKNHLGISKWLVFGGSWGSTLAIAYAVKFSKSVSALILRGIFLSRADELNWFLNDVKQFYPDAWDKLISFIPFQERDQVLNAYQKRVFSEDHYTSLHASINWNNFESGIMSLKPSPLSSTSVPDSIQIARARIQIHYIKNGCFVDGDEILNQVHKLSDIPTVIIQGRYDMVCPPITAWELSNKIPNAELHIIDDAGHSAMEPGTASKLVEYTEKFKAII